MNKFKRILFILPLLAISLWAFGFEQNKFDEFISTDYSFSQEKKENKQSQLSSINFEENEIFLVEIEPENEVEIESFRFENFSFKLHCFNLKNKKLNFNFPWKTINKSIPLYDLFCNWKIHLN